MILTMVVSDAFPHCVPDECEWHAVFEDRGHYKYPEALLLSANLRDFEQVPELNVEDWLYD